MVNQRTPIFHSNEIDLSQGSIECYRRILEEVRLANRDKIFSEISHDYLYFPPEWTLITEPITFTNKKGLVHLIKTETPGVYSVLVDDKLFK